MHLACQKIEGHIIQHFDAGKRLFDVIHFQQTGFVHSGAQCIQASIHLQAKIRAARIKLRYIP